MGDEDDVEELVGDGGEATCLASLFRSFKPM